MLTNREFSKKLKTRIYDFIVALSRIIKTLDRRDPMASAIQYQIMRSATSIGANYIEAVATSSKKDFGRFLGYALNSANETQYWMRLFLDTCVNDKEKTTKLFEELVGIGKILGASTKTIRKSNR